MYVENTQGGNLPAPESIDLDKQEITVAVGRSHCLWAQVAPTNAGNYSIVWSSDNPNIATVSNGDVTAHAVGTTVVRANIQGTNLTACCNVEVTPFVPVSSISVTPKSEFMVVGQTAFLIAKVCPVNASNPMVTWNSRDDEIATVNETMGLICAHKAGQTLITATVWDGTVEKSDSCILTVQDPVPVTGISILPKKSAVNMGETKQLQASISPFNATNEGVQWCSSNDNIATVGSYTGQVQGKTLGKVMIRATSMENPSLSDVCTVYCDRYLYELENTYGFTEDVALLLRQFYIKIEQTYASYSRMEKAWVASRVLGGIIYGKGDSSMTSSIKWNDVAGQIYFSNEEDYFVDTLHFSKAEYELLRDAIKNQHGDSATPDFVHMQISLAARLAYRLNLDGVLSNIGTLSSDETVSYLAGWLGDATLTNSDNKTSMADDDYCADLDAENIYRIIAESPYKNYINAINFYYDSLTINNTRAQVFLTHIPYNTVKEKTLSELDLNGKENAMEILAKDYPDTYSFLCALSNNAAHLD